MREYILAGIVMFMIGFCGMVIISSFWSDAPAIIYFIPIVIFIILAPILVALFSSEPETKVNTS